MTTQAPPAPMPPKELQTQEQRNFLNERNRIEQEDNNTAAEKIIVPEKKKKRWLEDLLHK